MVIVLCQGYMISQQQPVATAEILALLHGCRFISTIDAASFFYQFLVRHRDRYKLTVGSHRGQETFNCALMGYRNSPSYAQRTIDRILRKHRRYARAYIDDIVIFSTTLEEHLAHLRAVFTTLLEFDVCLSPRKSFLGYPSVQLLGQRVDALGMATDDDKLEAIAKLAFPKTLRQLEHYLGLTGYLREYIPHYGAVSKPLHERKKRLYKVLQERSIGGNARKKEAARLRLLDPLPAELKAFHELQQLFASPRILRHFDEKLQLYVDLDASKEAGFGAHVYHAPSWKQSSPSEAPNQNAQQPILFLSRLLTDAETRYWPTELEVAGLVWVVKKIRHMIEASMMPAIIFTDHSAAVSIVRQTSMNTVSTEKLNLRLIRASEYLQRFRLDVRYKPGKTNIVPDALSRLAKSEDSAWDNWKPSAVDEAMAHPIAIVEMSRAFKDKIKQGYEDDRRCQRVIAMVRDNDALAQDAARLPFKLTNGFLYSDDKDQDPRLVIPETLEKEIFQAAHDEHGHIGYDRTHERLTSNFYLFNMAKKLKAYVAHCPDCQARRTPRHRPFGAFQPVLTPAAPFVTIAIDFILALPTSVPDRFDAAMTATDKFTKAVTAIPGKATWNGAQWAVVLLDRLLLILWGIPRALISDRDAKFVGQLWSTILERLDVKLIFTTAWHPSADGMSERTNQTIEIALRYFLATLEDHREWPTVLPRLTATLSNSTSRATNQPPTQVLYGRRIKEALDLARVEDHGNIIDIGPEELPRRHAESAPAYPAAPVPVNPPPYRPTHIDAKDAIALSAMIMKKQYDGNHLPRYFDVGDWVSLRLHKGYTVAGLRDRNVKIEQQFAGPFEVIERIGKLAYRLRLPPSMRRLHPVISIAHLEPAHPPNEDPYQRAPSQEPILTPDGSINRRPERLLNKRIMARRNGGQVTEYLVRYEGLGAEYDDWLLDRSLPVAMRLAYERQQAGLPVL